MRLSKTKPLKGKATLGRFRSVDATVEGQYTGWLWKAGGVGGNLRKKRRFFALG